MFSNLIIAVTLLNAGAVLNFKLSSRKEEEGFDFGPSSSPTGDQLKNVLTSLRSLRVFIAVWNLFVCFLMVTLFGG